MKILVKGYKNIRLEFRCGQCGSKYIANSKEYEIDKFSGSPKCNCPICGSECYGSYGVVE